VVNDNVFEMRFAVALRFYLSGFFSSSVPCLVAPKPQLKTH